MPPSILSPTVLDQLQQARLAAADSLLHALDLELTGPDCFRADCETGRFGRIFGGQLLAQAFLAASRTVAGQQPASLHAFFTGAGSIDAPVDLSVQRIRDGRSLSTRRVELSQQGRPLLVAMASFHTNPTEPELAFPPPSFPGPDETPLLQDWAAQAPPELATNAQNWIDRPPPVEMKIAESPYFMGGTAGTERRSHWMRMPREIGPQPVLQAALLAYASDFLLLDMAFRGYPKTVSAGGFNGVSLDHTIWIHRPIRFDRWHLHTQELVALSGERGVIRGSLHDEHGQLIASVTQEVLVRVTR